MTVWSYIAASYRCCSGSVKDWVEFLSSKQHLSSVSDMPGPVTCIRLCLQDDDKADDVRQLLNILVQAISTHCVGFERIEQFSLHYNVRRVHSEKIAGRDADWAYKASDAIPHHLDAMTRELCRFLGNLPLAITKFTFCASLLHPKVGTRMLASLCENRHLTELDIVEFQAVRFPFTTTIPPCQVMTLWVSEHFGTRNEECSFLMRSFFNRETSRLQKFAFQDSHATELDAEAIILLKSNTHLQHLNLNRNPLGDAGASLIAEVLKVNKTLKHLDIGRCGIGDQGCMTLAEALHVNNTLEQLNLDGNEFADAAVRAFVASLTANRSLRRLGLESRKDPDHSEETEEELLRVVRHFLLPLELNIQDRGKRLMVYKACGFNCCFHQMCQKLRDGTSIFDNYYDPRLFLVCGFSSPRFPSMAFLGSTHPLVKQTLLFLVLRQRAEVASQSLLLLPTTCCKRRNIMSPGDALYDGEAAKPCS